MAIKPTLNRYEFQFTEFDNDHQMTFIAKLKTKPVEEKRAKELLVEELAKRGKTKNFCYHVMKNGAYINLMKKGK